MNQLIKRLNQKYPLEAAEWGAEHAQYALGLPSIDDIPPSLTDADTAKVLGVKSDTVKVWRCTGDRKIQYSKTGRSAANSTLSVLQVLIESGRVAA